MKKLIALAVMLGVTSAFAGSFTAPISYTFGSNNDGDGGFTTPTPSGSEVWTNTAGSVNYSFGVPGIGDQANDEAHTSSLLKQIDLWRAPDTGLKYTVTGTFDFTNGYGDDNNRGGLLLFNDSATQTADGGGGLYLRVKFEDPGSKSGVRLADGINGSSFAEQSALNIYGDDWVGETVTYKADFFFTNVGGTDKIDVTYTFIDSIGETVLNAQVDAANYTGEYFGFATKMRDRDAAPTRMNPTEIDYTSFSIVPEPATVGMFGFFGAAILLIRRRLAKR